MSVIVSICQSNYIPWKGYFDLIKSSDIFVIYDHVQYTKNDWRNRNLIKSNQGLQWLTIPVSQNKLGQKINETMISYDKWNIKHWKTLKSIYSKSPFFKEYSEYFEELYFNTNSKYISEINQKFIKSLIDLLEIKTKVILSSNFETVSDKNENLINILLKLNATEYLSGPSAKDYIDEKLFTDNGINVKYIDYTNYQPYTQLHGEFEHGVSILDLIFNVGLKEINNYY